MNQAITIEIARLPLKTVEAAFFKYNPSAASVWCGKADAVLWLSAQVENGNLTLDDIRNAVSNPRPVKPLPPTSTIAIDRDALSALNGDVASLANKLDDLSVKVSETVAAGNDIRTNNLNGLRVLRIEVEDVKDRLITEVASIKAGIEDAVQKAKPDTTAVQYEVARAVSDAFAPFRKAVEDAGAQHIVADLSSVVPVGLSPVSSVFGVHVTDIKGKELQVEVWNHPDAPAIDPDFIWTEDILRHLILAERHGDNLWFGGEKGTGKSETARQFAARTGRAFKRINFHKHTSAEEYVGAVGLVSGETVFQPKDFLQAYTSPSTVILLDEVTNADPGELAPLNGFLEPNAAVSFGGATHRRAPGVLVFAADNTFGNGDDTGRHVGTRLQNSALIDRFARVIPFTFLPEHQEVEALVRRTGCTREIAQHVLSAVTVARQKVQSAEIVDAPSIRSAMAFIRSLSVLPPITAWQTAVVARQPAESHAELNSIFTACINADFIRDNL